MLRYRIRQFQVVYRHELPIGRKIFAACLTTYVLLQGSTCASCYLSLCVCVCACNAWILKFIDAALAV